MTGEITTRAKCNYKQIKDTLFSLGEEEHLFKSLNDDSLLHSVNTPCKKLLYKYCTRPWKLGSRCRLSKAQGLLGKPKGGSGI